MAWLLLFLASCSGVPGSFPDDLSQFAGCNDLTFWAGSDNQRVDLRWESTGQVAAATDAKATTEVDYILPADGVRLYIGLGEHLQNPCTGLLDAEPIERSEVQAVSGLAHLELVPFSPQTGEFDNAWGTLTLTDVDFEDGSSLSALAWTSLEVGTVPGG